MEPVSPSDISRVVYAIHIHKGVKEWSWCMRFPPLPLVEDSLAVAATFFRMFSIINDSRADKA
jgi:hypothetical protein